MTRFQPIIRKQVPIGAFENLLYWGQKIPGLAGYLFYRQLKKKFATRSASAWQKVVNDLGKGDVCIDLGANVGNKTLQLAQTGAEVFAFEPDPIAFARMVTSIGIGKNITLIQKAAWHEAGDLLMTRPKRSDFDLEEASGGSSLVRGGRSRDYSNAFLVEAVDFPNFLEGLDRHIRLIKIDIEGAEWQVLDALLAHPVARRIDCIFVETHEWVNNRSFVPEVLELQRQVETMRRPYVSLFWNHLHN